MKSADLYGEATAVVTNFDEICGFVKFAKFVTTAVASPYSRSLYDNNIYFKILKYITSVSSSFKL